MNIHHQVVKTAAKSGIVLTVDDEGIVSGHHTESNLLVIKDSEQIDGEVDASLLNDTARDVIVAITDIRDWMVEHDSFLVAFEDDDFVGYAKNSKGQRGQELARDPDHNDLFESLLEIEQDGDDLEAEDADEDGDGDGDGEDEPTGSVVPERYKLEYAARGDATTCGDWLALELNKLCKVTDEKGKETTDLDRLEAIANSNDVAPARYGKLGVETNGWQGRYRMTIRNMLTPRVAAKGFLFIPEGQGVKADTERKAPRQWCIEHSPKPKAAGDVAGRGKATASAKIAKAPTKAQAKKAAEELGLETARKAIQGT